MRGLTDPATYIPEIIGFIIVLAFILRSISSEEPHKHLTDEVVGLFEDFSEHYSHRYDLKNTAIIKFIRKHGKDNQNVLEVGGNNGSVLDNIFKYTPIKRGYNLELTTIFSKYQVNKDIIFINGSALNLPFKDNTFDFVVIRHLLHHLVGRSRSASKENAHRAVDELIRVTKSGGYVIIEEEYNKYNIFGTLTFYILLAMSRIKMSSEYFSIHKNLIVSFLTIKEIKSLLGRENIKIVEEGITKWNPSRKFKITILMSKLGSVFWAGLKGGDEKLIR